MILELSATPTDQSNVLVDIKGIELSREEMIKLDLHVINKTNPNWKDTLLASVDKRNVLEKKAIEYEANTGVYIRPICLIQVERTGKDQRGGRFIHAEDVREQLIKVVGIPENQVAVTSSELKEIEGIDLLAKNTEIRYIITKQALQEGWDCPFAYVLTVLTNPQSKSALTQLVGRILRQPYARKTKIPELDESYVYTFQQSAGKILSEIKIGFEDEGLGDLTTRIIDIGGEKEEREKRYAHVQSKFGKSIEHFVLPMFVINDNGTWRLVSYDQDILSRINWLHIDLHKLETLTLKSEDDKNVEMGINLSKDEKELIESHVISRTSEGGLVLDTEFVARQLIDVIPNPWIAYETAEKTFKLLSRKYNRLTLINNLVFIIEELKKELLKQSDLLAQKVFDDLVKKEMLRFMVVNERTGYKLPNKIEIAGNSVRLNKSDGEPLQQSLFDFVPQEELNDDERDVAWYLEDQERMFFWYRNRARNDYAVQGWRKQKIYPDFIFTTNDRDKTAFNKVYVVETKGIHLKNEDTAYKESVFDLCNRLSEEKNISELGFKYTDTPIRFNVVFSDEWKRKLNEILS